MKSYICKVLSNSKWPHNLFYESFSSSQKNICTIFFINNKIGEILMQKIQVYLDIDIMVSHSHAQWWHLYISHVFISIKRLLVKRFPGTYLSRWSASKGQGWFPEGWLPMLACSQYKHNNYTHDMTMTEYLFIYFRFNYKSL